MRLLDLALGWHGRGRGAGHSYASPAFERQKPRFIAADVCRVLEHSNSRVALKRLDDDEKGVTKVYTLGGEQEMNIISESGLYALVLRGNTPAVKRFRKWVTSEVLPAIRRDGSYGLPLSDREELDEKRAYYRALPDAHRTRADDRAEALRQIEDLIARSSRVGAAIDAIAADMGLSTRTIYHWRRAAYMVPRSDWGAAMAPRWSGPRAMLAECHPEALKLFTDLSSGPGRVSDIYRRVAEEAARNNWLPVPCERTMRRLHSRLIARPAPQRMIA